MPAAVTLLPATGYASHAPANMASMPLRETTAKARAAAAAVAAAAAAIMY